MLQHRRAVRHEHEHDGVELTFWLHEWSDRPVKSRDRLRGLRRQSDHSVQLTSELLNGTSKHLTREARLERDQPLFVVLIVRPCPETDGHRGADADDNDRYGDDPGAAPAQRVRRFGIVRSESRPGSLRVDARLSDGIIGPV